MPVNRLAENARCNLSAHLAKSDLSFKAKPDLRIKAKPDLKPNPIYQPLCRKSKGKSQSGPKANPDPKPNWTQSQSGPKTKATTELWIDRALLANRSIGYYKSIPFLYLLEQKHARRKQL